MALFGKDRERGEKPRPVPVGTGPTHGLEPGEAEMFEQKGRTGQSEEPSGTSAFLGKGTHVTGKLMFEGDALTIGESAVVNANIAGSSVVIHGRVTGDVTARKRLEIRAPGRLIGNILTPSLVIHEGVVFEGHCAMGNVEAQRGEKDRKIAHFPKDERPAEGVALKVHSEAGK